MASIIAFDLDNIVRDTGRPFLKALNERLGTNYSIDAMIHPYFQYPIPELKGNEDIMWEVYMAPGFTESMPVIPGMKDVVNIIGPNAIIITHQPEHVSGFKQRTKMWLQKEGICCGGIYFGGGPRKIEIMRKLGITWIVEDHPETVRLALEAGFGVVMVEYPWNIDAISKLQKHPLFQFIPNPGFPESFGFVEALRIFLRTQGFIPYKGKFG